MRPAPIPDSAVPEGGVRQVMSAPDGDLLNPDILPVECVVTWDPNHVPVFTVQCVLEPGDLRRLAAGSRVTISFYGRMPPFGVGVQP